MKVQFRKSFEKDLRKLRNTQLLAKIKTIILEVENANILEDINNIKKLTSRGSFYRIRVGDYRIGIVAANDEITFVRLLHRKEIYRYFP